MIELCSPSCRAADFSLYSCAPICEVFFRLTSLVHNIDEILTNQVLDEVHRHIAPQLDTPDSSEYTVYDMNFPNRGGKSPNQTFCFPVHFHAIKTNTIRMSRRVTRSLKREPNCSV